MGYNQAIANLQWHHVALVKKADQYGLYIDGVQVGYLQTSETLVLDGDLYIGSRGPSDYWLGWIDELRIYRGDPFDAAPQPDNSDTIVVPTTAH